MIPWYGPAHMITARHRLIYALLAAMATVPTAPALADPASPTDLMCESGPEVVGAPQLRDDAEGAVRQVMADGARDMGFSSLADALFAQVTWAKKEALTADDRAGIEQAAMQALIGGRLASLFQFFGPWVAQDCGSAATVPQAGVMKVLRRVARDDPWFQLSVLADQAQRFSGDRDGQMRFAANLTEVRELMVRADSYLDVPARREPLLEAARQRLSQVWNPLFGTLMGPAQPSTWVASCHLASVALELAYQREVSPYFWYFTWSKPVVRRLESAFYDAAALRSAQALFDRIKAEARRIVVEQILPRAAVSPLHVEQILAEFDAMALVLPQPVSDGDFRAVPGFPEPILDYRTEHVQQVRRTGVMNRLTMQMVDYLMPNAAYVPRQSVGAFTVTEHVIITPAYLRAASSNPDAVFFALSHEISHKFGPQGTSEGGIPLAGAYEGLYGCLSSQFPLSEGQSDEIFADWMGAEIMARELSREAGPATALGRLRTMVASHCEWVREDRSSLNRRGADYPTDAGHDNWRAFPVHPENIFRMEFIVGRHPVIQGLLGFSGQLPYCGMDGRIPPAVETASAMSPEFTATP